MIWRVTRETLEAGVEVKNGGMKVCLGIKVLPKG